jgi:hypothetical protein
MEWIFQQPNKKMVRFGPFLASQARHQSGAQQKTFAVAKRGLSFGPGKFTTKAPRHRGGGKKGKWSKLVKIGQNEFSKKS